MKAHLPSTAWERNQYVMTAVVFVVFIGFAFVLPFLPLFVRELGVADKEAAALWAGVLIGVSPLLAGLLAPGLGPARRPPRTEGAWPSAPSAPTSSCSWLSALVRNV